MIISEYFDLIENTEKEQLVLENIAKSLSEVKDDLAKAERLPFLGKTVKAILALGKAESIEEFRKTKHYANLKNWDINVEGIEKGNIQINPSEIHKQAAFEWLVVIGAVLFGFWLGRKFGRRK